jgi:hypothetical protein
LVVVTGGKERLRGTVFTPDPVFIINVYDEPFQYSNVPEVNGLSAGYSTTSFVVIGEDQVYSIQPFEETHPHGVDEPPMLMRSL